MKLDHLPIALGALLCAGLAFYRLQLPLIPEGTGPLAQFAVAFAQSARREQALLFPLGVASSIATLLVLFRHGEYGSLRGALHGGAALILFAIGLLSTLVGAPTAKAIQRAAESASVGELATLLARWRFGHTLEIALAFAVLACLAAAARRPPPSRAESASGLSVEHRTLLFLLGTATLFHGYDTFIVSMALPYIGRDLGASETTLGFALSAIRMGALASVVFGRIADRRGRRGLLLVTVLFYTVATGLTGLSQGIIAFVALQFIAQIFLVAEISIAQVVIAEEFPTTFRSIGQGLLGTFNALGSGLAAMLFPLFQESPLGWRGLYFVGISPLLLIAYLRRSLPETARWHAARGRGETEQARIAELVAVDVRGRFLLLLVLSFAVGASAAPAFGFASYRATTVFGWSPSEVSAMVLLGGGFGIAGWSVFGIAAERVGRRSVGVTAFAGTGAAIFLYYSSPWLWLGFAVLVFSEAGAMVALNSLGTELFPTRLRSTAKSWITTAAVLGAVCGMAAVGTLGPRLGGADAVIRLLAIMPLAFAGSLLVLPETRGHELEQITEHGGAEITST